MSGGIKIWANEDQAHYVPNATETTKTVKTTTKTTVRKEVRQSSSLDHQPSSTVPNHVGQPQAQTQGANIWASSSPLWGQPQDQKQHVPQPRGEPARSQQQPKQNIQKPGPHAQPNQQIKPNQQRPSQNMPNQQQQPPAPQSGQRSQPQPQGQPGPQSPEAFQPTYQQARQLWNDTPVSTQPKKIEFEETEQEKLRKQQQQQFYRRMREQQERDKVELEENKRRAQFERERQIRERDNSSEEEEEEESDDEDPGCTVEIRPAPAPLDSELWPPKQSNMQPLPRTGFYPQEVRREQDKSPKKLVWPPAPDNDDDEDAPAGVRGGVARAYLPPSTVAVDTWNPQSPGTSRRLPEWAKYRPQRMRADNIWPPRDASLDDQVELERPEPRKSHRLDYIKMGSKVPVTYHSPPGTQHTSIEGRYPYAT